ncbi:50S ribosomal protein L28 [Lactococcus fujiensis]|nr:50S ribosomal protein L28 [Lactococcus fujiensis]
MSKVCYFTGAGTTASNNRSHAMNQTKRVVKPNLQKVKIIENGQLKTVWATAKALKKLPAGVERA